SWHVTTDPDYITNMYTRRAFRSWYATYYSWVPTMWDMEGGAWDKTAARSSLQLTKPEHWPEITLKLNRFMAYARFHNGCKIMCDNPISGELMKLYFNTTGTTFRGARRNRGLDTFP